MHPSYHLRLIKTYHILPQRRCFHLTNPLLHHSQQHCQLQPPHCIHPNLFCNPSLPSFTPYHQCPLPSVTPSQPMLCHHLINGYLSSPHSDQTPPLLQHSSVSIVTHQSHLLASLFSIDPTIHILPLSIKPNRSLTIQSRSPPTITSYHAFQTTPFSSEAASHQQNAVSLWTSPSVIIPLVSHPTQAIQCTPPHLSPTPRPHSWYNSSYMWLDPLVHIWYQPKAPI